MKQRMVDGKVGSPSLSLSLATALACGALFGVSVEWTPGATSLADGAVTIEYAEGSIARLTADAAGMDRLTITGADAMTFATNAIIAVSNGTLRFEAPIVGDGALHVQYPIPSFVWDAVESGRNDYLPDSEAQAVVVATGASLDAYAVQRGAAGMKELGYYYGSGDNNVKPYFVQRGEGTYECQMQHLSDKWNKCITLKLKQVGDDIVAWTPNALYADYRTVAPLGTDFRTIKYNNMGVSSVAAKRSGYGLDGLTLVPIAEIVNVEVANGVTLGNGGTLTIGAGVTFTADGPTSLAADGVWDTPLQINGTFRLADPYGMSLGGVVKYGDYGRYEGIVETARPATEAFTLDAPKWPSGDWQTFATNVTLAAIENVTANSGGGSWFDSGTPYALKRSWIENDGQVLTVQLAKAWDGTYFKGVVYQVRQAGIYLQHRICRSAYLTTNVDPATTDLRTAGSTMNIYNGGANGNGNGYGLQDIRLYGKAGVSRCGLNIRSVQYRSPRGAMYFEGREDSPLVISCDGTADLPENMTIGAYANFFWDGTGNYGTATTAINIEEKGAFSIIRGWQYCEKMVANVNGGTFNVFPLTTTSDATSIYMESVNFVNGGHVSCNIPRVGYYGDAIWTVRGTKPAFIDKGVAVVGNGSGSGAPFNRMFKLDVDDVTGSGDPDLTVNGNIYYSNKSTDPAYNWVKAHVVKTGEGTVRHNGVMSVDTYPLVISNGTWQVTRSGGIVAGCGLELSGGTLGIDDACALSLGTLSLGRDTTSGIKLGAGSTVTFGSLDGVRGSIVAIEAADPVKAVRVGTSQCLTSAQLRCLRINGQRVHQDDEGYICLGGRGAVLLLK